MSACQRCATPRAVERLRQGLCWACWLATDGGRLWDARAAQERAADLEYDQAMGAGGPFGGLETCESCGRRSCGGCNGEGDG